MNNEEKLDLKLELMELKQMVIDLNKIIEHQQRLIDVYSDYIGKNKYKFKTKKKGMIKNVKTKLTKW